MIRGQITILFMLGPLLLVENVAEARPVRMVKRELETASSKLTPEQMVDSVIFQKVAHTLTTRSTWLMTFYVDLEPYRRVLLNLRASLNKAKIDHQAIRDEVNKGMRENLTRLYPDTSNVAIIQLDDFVKVLDDQKVEIDYLITMYTDLRKKFKNIKDPLLESAVAQGQTDESEESDNFPFEHLTTSEQRRTKRFIDFTGGLGFIFNSIFGGVSKKAFNRVRDSLNQLGQEHNKLVTIVKDQISLLDLTRRDVKANRMKINHLLVAVRDLVLRDISQERMINLLLSFRDFAMLKTNMRHEIALLSSAVHYTMMHFTQLFNMIGEASSGKLTANVVPPRILKEQLAEITKGLSRTILKLPVNPYHDLWHYYKYIKIDSFIYNGRFAIIATIPLMDGASELNLYTAISLPIVHDESNRTATYLLETDKFALSDDGLRYSIPSDEDYTKCVAANNHFCTIGAPQYHTNKHTMCVLALYMQNTYQIEQFCRIRFSYYTAPQAIYMTDGKWAIATRYPEKFTVKCPRAGSEVETIKGPIGYLELRPACEAASMHVILPAYFQGVTELDVSPDYVKKPPSGSVLGLKSYRVWADVTRQRPHDPEILANLQKMDPVMSYSVQGAKDLLTYVPLFWEQDDNKQWVVLIVFGSIIVIIIIIIIIVKLAQRNPWFQALCVKRVPLMPPISTGKYRNLTDIHTMKRFQQQTRHQQQSEGLTTRDMFPSLPFSTQSRPTRVHIQGDHAVTSAMPTFGKYPDPLPLGIRDQMSGIDQRLNKSVDFLNQPSYYEDLGISATKKKFSLPTHSTSELPLPPPPPSAEYLEPKAQFDPEMELSEWNKTMGK